MDWEQRYRDAETAFQQLKAMTKRVPARKWTPEYRALAERIHTLGRDVFYVSLPCGGCGACLDCLRIERSLGA